MAKQSNKAVSDAIKGIRDYYKLGVQLAKSKKPIRDEAEKLGMDVTTAKRARGLADPKSGYTEQEIDELCDLILTHRRGKHSRAPIVRRSHFVRVLFLPRPTRHSFLKNAIKHGWTIPRVDLEIAARFGARQKGGRPAFVSNDSRLLYAQIERMSRRWSAWFSQVKTQPRKPQLPRRVRASVDSVYKALCSLHRAVEGELNKGKDYKSPSTDADRGR